MIRTLGAPSGAWGLRYGVQSCVESRTSTAILPFQSLRWFSPMPVLLRARRTAPVQVSAPAAGPRQRHPSSPARWRPPPSPALSLVESDPCQRGPSPRERTARAPPNRLAPARRPSPAEPGNRQGTHHPGRGAVRPLARRADLGGLRARGHHLGAGGGRGRRRCTWCCPSPSPSWRSWPSWSSPTARSSTPTPGAVGPMPSPGPTSAPGASLVAAASLVVDYTLTVAVSIAAGVAALHVGLPVARRAPPVPLCLGILVLHHRAQPARPR